MVYIDDHIDSLDVDAALAAVDPERREYALRYKHERSQRQCLAAWLLLQQALRQEYGITGALRLLYNEHGKPSLIDYPDIYFNLSHCRDAVACIVGDSPVGVDVECIDRYRPLLLNYTMSEQERQLIAASPHPATAFIRLWTMKEAVLKLSGEGIRDDLKCVLQGKDGFQTVVNQEKNYIYSIVY
jgi:4'-phosphopantetheinyl transferase